MAPGYEGLGSVGGGGGWGVGPCPEYMQPVPQLFLMSQKFSPVAGSVPKPTAVTAWSVAVQQALVMTPLR